MAKDSNGIKDIYGKYNINEGYKYISGGNSEEAYKLITEQITEIISGDYNTSKRENYRVKSHLDSFDWETYRACKEKKPFRKEEWICKHCMGQEFKAVGNVVDYQVPLKHSAKDECKGLGKIDLISRKGNEGYLLEVKVPNSTEEPLRAIMEIYTYWQQLGGENCQHFLENSNLNGVTVLKKGIVIYRSEQPNSIYQKLISSRNDLRTLMKWLQVECFIAEHMSREDDLIGEIVKCNW